MKIKYFAWVFAVMSIIFIALVVEHSHTVNKKPLKKSVSCAAAGSYSLITEPDDGIAPVLAMINDAKRSIDLVMYELSDRKIEVALTAAEKRGVAVRVLLDGGYDEVPQEENIEAYNYFYANDVPVHWTPTYFTLTHEKSLIVDGVDDAAPGAAALIMSFNLTPQYYANDRDFGIIDSNPCDIMAMESTFDSDWNASGNNASGDLDNNLIWSPGSRSTSISLIASAKKSLYVYNEEMDDTGIENALEAAAARGVEVDVLMTYSDEWENAFKKLIAAGVHIKIYAPNAKLYIHAKMILIDAVADGWATNDSRVFIGSENFSPTSLDKNRELGIILSDPKIIQSLRETFIEDEKSAQAL